MQGKQLKLEDIEEPNDYDFEKDMDLLAKKAKKEFDKENLEKYFYRGELVLDKYSINDIIR